MNNAARLGAGVAGGYLLGRTKKLKLAIGLGAWLMGKRLNLSPTQLAMQGLGQLRDTPEFLDLTERLRGEVGGAGRRALAAVAMSRMDSLADRLHDHNLGIVEGTVLSDEDEYDDERDEEDDGDDDAATYDEEDDYDDQQDFDDEDDEEDEDEDEDEDGGEPRDADADVDDFDEDEEEDEDEDYDDEPKSRRDDVDEPYPEEEQQPTRSRSGSRSRGRGGQR